MNDIELSPWQRIVLAFWAFFAVLFRIQVAAGVHRVREAHRAGALPPAPEQERLAGGPPAGPAAGARSDDAARPAAGAGAAPVPGPGAAGAGSAAPAPGATAPGGEPAARVIVAERASSGAATAVVATAARAEPARVEPPARAEPDTRAALQVLAVLQREGRLVDFIEEDLAGFPDAAIGAAARTVHAGCKKAIEEVFRLEPVFREPEGAQVTIADGFDPAAVRLTGNVVGKPPFRGSLRHHGWRAREVKLPAPPDGKELTIVAPAEVEL